MTVVLITCSGCKRSRVLDNRLESVDQLLTELPKEQCENENKVKKADSIFALIDRADTLRMSRRQRSLYELLRAELDYKHFSDTFDLPAIEKAISYFKDNEDKNRLMRALFIRSIQEFENREYIKSITTALQAERIARELNNILFLAKINDQISLIYNRDGNRKECKNHAYLAAQYFKEYGDETLFQWTMIDYCLMMISSKEYTEAITLLDSIIPKISKKDIPLLLYSKESLAIGLLEVDSLARANEIIEQIKSMGIENKPDVVLLFDLAYKQNRLETLKLLLTEILNSKEPQHHNGIKKQSLYKYHKAIGNTDSALYYYEKLYDIYTESMLSSLDQSIVRAESDYNAENALLNKRIADKNRLLFIFSSIIIILILIYYILYSKWLKEKRRREIEEKVNMIEQLFANIEENKQFISTLNKELVLKEKQLDKLNHSIEKTRIDMDEKINTLYNEQFRELNRLCNEYYCEGEATEKLKLTVYNKIHSILKNMSDPKKIAEIEKSLNLYRNNIILKLRADYSDLKKDDITFIILLFAGLGSKAICIICNITTGNFYVKRRRLKLKIENSNSKYKELYLKYI